MYKTTKSVLHCNKILGVYLLVGALVYIGKIIHAPTDKCMLLKHVICSMFISKYWVL